MERADGLLVTRAVSKTMTVLTLIIITIIPVIIIIITILIITRRIGNQINLTIIINIWRCTSRSIGESRIHALHTAKFSNYYKFP